MIYYTNLLKILEMQPDPVPRFRLPRDVLHLDPSDTAYRTAKKGLQESKWVALLKNSQMDEVDRLLNDFDSDKRILAFCTSIYLVAALINELGLVNFFESMTKLSQSGPSFPNHLRNTQQCANTAKYFLPMIAQHVNGCESGKKGSSSRYLCMGAM